MPAMQIQLQIGGVSGVVGGLNAIVRGYQRVAVAQQQVLANAARIKAMGAGVPAVGQAATPANAGGARGGNAAGSAATPAKAGGAGNAAAGPMARYQKARAQLSAALLHGTQAEIFDAQHAVEQAKAAVERAEKRLQGGGAVVSGPFQRLEKARQQLQEAVQRGVDTEIADATLALRSAEEAAGRAEQRLRPKTFGDRLLDLLGTSRFSAGSIGGVEIMPLLNKVGGLFGTGAGQLNPGGLFGPKAPGAGGLPIPAGNGPGSGGAGAAGQALNTLAKLAPAGGKAAGALTKLGPVAGQLGQMFASPTFRLAAFGVALNAGVSAARMFVSGVRRAATDLGSIGRAARLGGGKASDVAKLEALGIPVGQIPQMAAQFRAATQIGADVRGIIARQKLGLPLVTDRRFGKVDEVGDLLKAVEGLRRLPPQERVKIARDTTLEGALGSVDVSDPVWNQRQADAGSLALMVNKGGGANVQAATDFEAQSQRLSSNLKRLSTGAFAPFIGMVADSVGQLADMARDAAPAVGGLVKFVGDLGRIIGFPVRVMGKLVGLLGHLLDKTGLLGALEKLLGSVTWAIGALADALDKIPGMDDGKIVDNQRLPDFQARLKEYMDKSDSKRNSAIDKNTEATNRLTAAIERGEAGTFGGGARARGALGPSAMQGVDDLKTEAMRKQVLALGYWSL